MKYTLAILALVFPLLIGTACNSKDISPAPDNTDNIDEPNNAMNTSITIKVGDKQFKATLFDNASTTALKAMLPITMNMTELNGNEKYFQLPKSLPTNASNPGTINTGDLLLWGSNTLVIFYETFSTSYSYTKLGKIDDPTGLASALGSGNVTVIFEKSQK